MDDTISRQAAIEEIRTYITKPNISDDESEIKGFNDGLELAISVLSVLPSAQPTIYGYNVEHLEMIARVLQKENLPPERVVEMLTDIGRIDAIVRDEFEEILRKVVEQCMTCYWNHGAQPLEWCSHAERRADETD